MIVCWMAGVASAITLEDALVLAEEHSAELQVAVEEEVQASALQNEVRAGALPQLSLDSTAAFNWKQIPAPTDLQIQGLDTSKLPLVRPLSFDVTLTGVQPLIQPAVWAGIGAAGAIERAAEHKVARVRQELRAAVARAYIGLQLSQQGLSVAERAVEVARLASKDVMERVAQGLSSENERRRAELEVLRGERELARIRGQRVQAEAAWRAVLHTPVPANLEPMPQGWRDRLPHSLEEAQEQALRRFDLLAAEAHLQGKRREHSARQLQRAPTLNLVVRGRLNPTPTLLDPLPVQAGAGLMLHWRLFQGGAIAARARILASQVRAAEAQQQVFVGRVRSEVEIAWYGVAEATAALRQSVLERELALEDQRSALSLEKIGGVTAQQVAAAELGVELAVQASRQRALEEELAVVELLLVCGML